NSYLPSITDFPLYRSIVSGLNEGAGWDTGLARIYYTLGQDFLYTDPFLNVIFVDNHDLVRFMTSVGEDPAKFKLGIVLLLTTRGIPQIYYGTEIMKMGGANDPDKRRLFPGGWAHHEISAFTEEGRKKLGEKRNLPIPEVFELIKKLSEWRRDKEVIHTGALTHFIPENNVYVYFRHNEDETVMVILNGDDSSKEINTTRFNEFLDGYETGYDIISEQVIELRYTIHLNPYQVYVIEL
ncbi:MAG: hypothetical protein EA359_17645, partial [Balneolaceae bacterium]